jgi:hypothetical protein
VCEGWVTAGAMTGRAVLQHRPGLRVLPLPDGGLTIYAEEASAAYVLNASAAEIWRRLDGAASVASVLQQVQRDHGPTVAAASDVLRLVEDLHHHRLVDWSPPAVAE